MSVACFATGMIGLPGNFCKAKNPIVMKAPDPRGLANTRDILCRVLVISIWFVQHHALQKGGVLGLTCCLEFVSRKMASSLSP